MSKRILFTALLGLGLAAGAATATEPAPAPAATPEDLAKTTAANPIPARDDEAVIVTVQPDGVRSIVLDESFLATSVVRIGPDGTPIIGCVTTREEFEAFFAVDAAAAVPAVEVR